MGAPAPAVLRVPAWLDAAPAPAELMVELRTRRNALEHLRRSQSELRAALLDAPADPDFASALAENELVLVRQAGRLAELEALAAAAAAAEAQGRPIMWVPACAWGDGAVAIGGPAAAPAAPPQRGSGGGAGGGDGCGGGGDPGLSL